MSPFFLSIALLIVAIALLIGRAMMVIMVRNNQLPPGDTLARNCQIYDFSELPGQKAAEDFVFVSEEWVIGSNLDPTLLRAGSSEVRVDALLGFHLPSRKMFNLEMENFPSNLSLHTHGLDFLPSSSILAAVNHAWGAGGEGLELFRVDMSEGGLPPKLVYLSSLRHPLLGMGKLNDVAIVNAEEKSGALELSIVVSEWIGMAGTEEGVSPYYDLFSIFAAAVKYKLTGLISCRLTSQKGGAQEVECLPLSEYSTMWNGVEFNSERTRFVAVQTMPEEMGVEVFRMKGGVKDWPLRLEKEGSIPLSFPPDNIQHSPALSDSEFEVYLTAGIRHATDFLEFDKALKSGLPPPPMPGAVQKVSIAKSMSCEELKESLQGANKDLTSPFCHGELVGKVEVIAVSKNEIQTEKSGNVVKTQGLMSVAAAWNEMVIGSYVDPRMTVCPLL